VEVDVKEKKNVSPNKERGVALHDGLLEADGDDPKDSGESFLQSGNMGSGSLMRMWFESSSVQE